MKYTPSAQVKYEWNCAIIEIVRCKMDLQLLLADIHALEEELLAFERK
jgi:hypothetical protein